MSKLLFISNLSVLPEKLQETRIIIPGVGQFGDSGVKGRVRWGNFAVLGKGYKGKDVSPKVAKNQLKPIIHAQKVYLIELVLLIALEPLFSGVLL